MGLMAIALLAHASIESQFTISVVDGGIVLANTENSNAAFTGKFYEIK